MRRLLPVLALAAVLVVAAAPALAAGPENRPATTPTDDKEKDKPERGDEKPREGREGRGRTADDARARGPSALGSFEVTSPSRDVQGEFVAFRYSDTGLDGFSVNGEALFSLRVEGVTPRPGRGGVEPDGAQVRLETPFYRLRVHDNPEAVTRIEADGRILLTLPEGANVTLAGDKHADFSVGDLQGVLRGESLSIAGRVVTATDRLVVLVSEPHGKFDVHRSSIAQAIGRGHVGAEASFNQAEGEVEQDVISYANVTLHKVKAERGNLTVVVDGHGFDGRVLVLNVDGRVLGAERADDLRVLFDNASIRHADTLADVLDPDNDGLAAEYYVVFDPAAQAFQMIVSVPHYSVHTISVTTFLAVAPPSVLIGVALGALILVPSAFVLFRRR